MTFKWNEDSDQHILIYFLQMVDGTYKREANQSILNTGPTAILLRLLPLIRKHDLQITMADNVASSCVNSDYSRMQCCNDGILSMVLDALESRESLHRKTQGNQVKCFFFLNEYICILYIIYCLCNILTTFSFCHSE